MVPSDVRRKAKTSSSHAMDRSGGMPNDLTSFDKSNRWKPSSAAFEVCCNHICELTACA
jgi:hypothetical protein